MPVPSLDASTPARWAGTPANGANVTSASFTAPSGAILVLCVEADSQPFDNAAADLTIAVSDSGGLTWTQRIEADDGTIGSASNLYGGGVFIWTAVTTSAASRTVSVQRSSGNGSSNRVSCRCLVFTGQDASPIGATERILSANLAATNNLTTQSITTTQADSVLVVAAADWSANGAGSTSPTSSDFTEDAASYSGQLDVLDGYKSAATVAAYTANLDSVGTGNARWIWAMLEIKGSSGGGNRRRRSIICTGG